MGEVVDYVTMAYPSAYTTTFFVVMTKDKWAAIDPADQKIIEEINTVWAAKHGDAWDSSDKDGIAFFQEKGGQIIELDEAENQRWLEAVAPVVNDYTASLDKLNVNGQEVIDFIRTTLNTLQQ
jgi:TRAP-type C4-dicarboxylate transport system substrate-binding protein